MLSTFSEHETSSKGIDKWNVKDLIYIASDLFKFCRKPRAGSWKIKYKILF